MEMELREPNIDHIILNGLFLDYEGKQSGTYFMATTIIKELLAIDDRYLLIATVDFEWAQGRTILVQKFSKKTRFLFESYYRNRYQGNLWVNFDYFLPYRLSPRKKRDIVIIHDLLPLDVKQSSSQFKRIWFKLQAKRSLEKSSSIITISEFSKSRLEHHFHNNSTNIIVIRNPVNLSRLSQFKPSAHVQSNGEYFLTIASPWKHKNLQTLIKVFTSPDSELKIPLIICGPRVHLMRGMSLGSSISHLGFVSDEQLGLLISGAKAVLAPSLYEGFGMTVYEALGLNKIVLASDLGVYEHNPNLIRVSNPENEQSWHEALSALLAAPPKIQPTDLSTYSPVSVAKDYHEVIMETYEISK